MATQREIASKLLPLIFDATRRNRSLTYKGAAVACGFDPKYARAVAQACDLLDAAAAWAGVPLLALRCVLSSDGKYNPKAFGHLGQLEYRDAIFQRSIIHKYTKEDFEAISDAFEGPFADDTNISSWEKIYEQFGGKDIVWSRLASGGLLQADALDDLGSDIPDMRFFETTSFARDERVRQAVLRRANGRCEYCRMQGFKLPSGKYYLECHHIVFLANDGRDKVSNVIALCANDHRAAHFASDREKLEKRMIAIVAAKIVKRTRLNSN